MTTEVQNTQEPNPYNANKPWHKGIEKVDTADANSLFIPPVKTDPETNNNSAEPEKQPEPAPQNKAEKRYYDLKAHHDKTVSELRKEVEELRKKAEASGKDVTMPKTEEEVSQFKTRNPELFDMIVALARRETEDNTKAVQEKLKEVEARELKQKAEEARVAVMNAHPDFESLKDSDDFHDWAETQSEEIQSWIYNNPYNAKNAIAAITLYKAERGSVNKSQPSGKEQSAPVADAASLVSTRAQDVGVTRDTAFTPEQLKNMSLDEFERNKELIFKQLAQNKGRK